MVDEKKRFVNPDYKETDEFSISIRPKKLSDFIGQDEMKSNLKVFIDASKTREEAMDHILLYGPPGLGKTTLAQVVANEMEVNFRSCSAPMLTKQGDLAAILTSLEENDILFIDEIHRLSTSIEEVLYSAMEDFKLDLMLGEGPTAKSVKIDLPRFTLIGATTRTGLLSNPLRDRFGINLRLNFYDTGALSQIINRTAGILNTSIDDECLSVLASRSRGTPRIANRLLKRVRDFASVMKSDSISQDVIDTALTQLGIDKSGLDALDRQYLMSIIKHYAGGPVGIDTLSAVLSEPSDTLEDVIEPYLLQCGFIQRTPRGRVVTPDGYSHMNIKIKED